MTQKTLPYKGRVCSSGRCSLSSLHQLPTTKISILSPPIKEVSNIKVFTKTALIADPTALRSLTSHHQQTDMARRATSTRKPYRSLLSSMGTPGHAIVSHAETAAQVGSGRALVCANSNHTAAHARGANVKARCGGRKEKSQIITIFSSALVLTAEPISLFLKSTSFRRVRACVYVCDVRQPPRAIFRN